MQADLRVALVIHSLACGGAERVATVLADGLAQRGHAVMVLTSEPPETDFFLQSPTVERRSIGPLRQGGFLQKSWNNVLRLLRLRRLLRSWKPATIISFMPIMNVRVLLATLGSGVPVIVTEHVHPLHQPLSIPFRVARRIVYPLAVALVSVSAGVDRCFGWLAPRKRAVIHNPLPEELEAMKLEAPAWSGPPGRNMVATMGRLHPQKGIDLLLEAFADLAPDHPSWDLLILGEGSQRPALEAQVARLGLGERVHLPGVLKNPFAVLYQCDLFALASRFEGFGNVLVEAMACELPVVATDCESGPSEIVDDEENGLLVPVEDVAALRAALGRAMSDERLRQRLGAAGRRAAERYRPVVVLQAWQRLLASLVDDAGRAG